MVRDLLRHTPDPHTAPADVCVVGAGAAGICLALELTRAGKRVLLLEGGGAAFEEAAQEPYVSYLDHLHHRGVHEGRFRIQGGTTTRWGGQILPLDPIDFEVRPWVPGSGWPIARQNLLPFYERALQVEGLENSCKTDAAVWKRLGESEPSFGPLTSHLSRWCPEPNFARLYGRNLEEDERLELWLHANAVELLFRNETAHAVRVRTQGGKGVTFHAQEFVFCLGAIESSRFFLQPLESSGRSPQTLTATLPWNRSGLLGRNFQDHIDCNAATLKPRSHSALHRCFDGIFLQGFKYQPKLKLRPEQQCNHRTLNVGASLAFEHPHAEAQMQIRAAAKNAMNGNLREMSRNDLRLLARHGPSLLRQTLRYAVRHRAWQPASAGISLRVHCEQEPLSGSSIALSDQRDSLGLFRTRLRWQIGGMELQTIRTFVQLAKRALSPVAQVTPMPDMEDDAALVASCEDSFHHMGGMRMHPSATQGVVDTDLRLHGTCNVWICSSAVFPTSGFSNPTHTLLALAIRLAAHLSRAARLSVGSEPQTAYECATQRQTVERA